MSMLILFTALLAQVDESVVTGKILVTLNDEFVSLKDFSDNEFLFEEKLAATKKKAGRYDGHPVRITVEVSRVRKDGLSVKFFPKQSSHPMAAVALVSDPEAEVDFEEADSVEAPYVGGTDGGSPYGKLAIGEHLPLKLAKTLREDDHLAITGEVREIELISGPHGLFGASKYSKMAGIVIVVDHIEKLSRFAALDD